MRNWLAVTVVGVVSAVTIGGCSSGSPPSTVASYCDLVATTECPPVTGVCAGVSEAACEAAVTATCNASATAAQAQQRVFQPNAVGACISALNSVYSALNSTLEINWQALNGTCGTTAPCPGSPNDTCSRVFQGQAPDNDPCTTTYECLPSSVCGSQGGCGPEQMIPLNGQCANAGDVCVDSVCSDESGQIGLSCTMGGQVGDTCNASKPCGTSSECKSGKCVALGEEGSPCASTADCDPTATKGSFCDTNVSKPICTLGYTFGTEAADCAAFGGAKQ